MVDDPLASPAGSLVGPELVARIRGRLAVEVPAEGPKAIELTAIDDAVQRRLRIGRSAGLSAEVSRLITASAIDIDVPTASSVPGGQVMKNGVKRLTGFYVRHVAQQVADLGAAMVRFGSAASSEVGRLDVEVAALREDVDRLRAELDRRERRQ